jgi:hypothetical protein
VAKIVWLDPMHGNEPRGTDGTVTSDAAKQDTWRRSDGQIQCMETRHVADIRQADPTFRNKPRGRDLTHWNEPRGRDLTHRNKPRG